MPGGSGGYTRGSPPVYPSGPEGYPPGGGVPRAPGRPPRGVPRTPPGGGPPGVYIFGGYLITLPVGTAGTPRFLGPPRGDPPYPPGIAPPGGYPPDPPFLYLFFIKKGRKTPKIGYFGGPPRGGQKGPFWAPPARGPPRARAGPPGGPPGRPILGVPGTPPEPPFLGSFWARLEEALYPW